MLATLSSRAHVSSLSQRHHTQRIIRRSHQQPRQDKMTSIFMTPVFPPNMIESIIRDHREFEKLWSQYQTEKQRDEREKIANELIRGVSIHNVIEEEVLYPVVAKSHIERAEHRAEHGLKEHQEAKEDMSKLMGMKISDAGYDELLKKIMEDLLHHTNEEEEKIFKQLAEDLGPVRLEELGRQLDAARISAPTRPHPHAPNSGAFVTPIAKAAAVIDKALDQAEGRPFPSNNQ
eukprot:TRINITY_DN3035_c0_g1_i1.p1 TRINITY_DN3035_c0_g1~~TRINITY_DN3035_c0_g1_i1.p1  ORF type:complete len:233 (-),score=75.84 TRINITY_DN3035_c0_g1_i1:46-744(-)